MFLLCFEIRWNWKGVSTAGLAEHPRVGETVIRGTVLRGFGFL
jgi:hypothetical protein